MLTQEEKAIWDEYCRERLIRYEMDKKDPLYNYRDVLRQSRPGQYIWELLQNAEDAKASHIYFELDEFGLTCAHNSKNHFNLEDAKSISKIGISGKNDKPAIGQFGTGFKSVFKYAERAEIHSGNLNFALEDYVKIINDIEIPKSQKDGKFGTTFYIKFEKSSKKIGYEDSELVLNSLNEESIIFLTSLKKIEIKTNRGILTIEKSKLTDDVVLIQVKSRNKISETSWLQTISNVETEVLDGNGNIKFKRKGNVSAAFKIQFSEDTLVGLPLSGGKVFTYFPLAHQESNLKFHINGPFAIDLGRTQFDHESRSNEENSRLIKQIANDVSKVIENLLSSGRANLQIVELLPIPSDQIAHELTPIKEAVISLFKSKKLISVAEDVLVSPSEVFNARENICDQFAGHGLNLLNSVTNSKFSRVDPVRKSVARYILPLAKSSRMNAFMRQVGVAEIDSEKLSEFFQELNWVLRPNSFDENRAKIASNLSAWTMSKSVASIQDLYLLIHKLDLPRSKILNVPLFRTYGDGNPEHKTVVGTFLASSETQIENDVLIREIFYKNDKNAKNHEELEEFFGDLNLEEKDPWVNLRLQLESTDITPNKASELERMKLFLDFYRKDKERLVSMIKNKIRIIGEDFSGTTYWDHPNNMFIPDELLNFANLGQLPDGGDKVLSLWTGYPQSVEFYELLSELGLTRGMRLINSGIARSITFLNTILKSQDLRLLKILWDFLPKISSADLQFFYNSKKSSTILPTTLLSSLKHSSWMPAKDGTFLEPEFISEENLHPSFIKQDLIVFDLIGFGEKSRFERVLSESANLVAQQAGFLDAETMELASKIAKDYSKEEMQHMLKIRELREKIQIDDLENATKVAIKQERLSPSIQQEEIEVLLRTTYEPAQEERKLSLRRLYGNENGDMPCQLCHRNQMPFKTPADDFGVSWDYFEAVAFFKNYKKESSKNTIALCPTCSAKIRHFRGTSPQLKDRQIAFEITRLHEIINHSSEIDNSQLKIEITLLDSQYIIKFNREHILALFAVIESNRD